MKAPKLEILAPLRTAIVGNTEIAALHPSYEDTIAVFTRRPVPGNAPYPLTIVGPMVTRDDNDGIKDFRPSPLVDITTYGRQKSPGDAADQLRTVDQIAELIYGLFHRQRRAVTVSDYQVTNILCTGPSPAPADDNRHIARRVSVRLRLYAR